VAAITSTMVCFFVRQKTQSEFYIRILHEHRAVPTYFRVGFYGAAFPPFLQVTVERNAALVSLFKCLLFLCS